MREILLSTGNIPVDRKSKDRRILFKGTFDTLAKGEVVALFPEGTSYTEPSIAQVKEGAARAAFEYVRWAGERRLGATEAERKRGGGIKRLQVVPVGVVYTDKTQYQSKVSG